ncbi:MAG: hypothetical protein HQK50_18495 [Oligoflexia bacterium]|nr:hypothetical protein [Oligoflexia bacterium]MBF0367571.1 hypothetical protein [Oligoflexia bacterium]
MRNLQKLAFAVVMFSMSAMSAANIVNAADTDNLCNRTDITLKECLVEMRTALVKMNTENIQLQKKLDELSVSIGQSNDLAKSAKTSADQALNKSTAGYFGIPWSELNQLHSGCKLNNFDFYCHSAVHQACKNRGYSAGILQETNGVTEAGVACFR